MNLLPTEFYAYSITVPDKGSVAYDTLKLYKYTALEAERDAVKCISGKLQEHYGRIGNY